MLTFVVMSDSMIVASILATCHVTVQLTTFDYNNFCLS